MVAILGPLGNDAWLQCRPSDAPVHLRQWTGELLADPDPLARPPRAISRRVVQAPGSSVDAETGELF